MRLADFILTNLESVLQEWEAFARSIWLRAEIGPAALRDHAEDMLRAMVADMKSDQTAKQQSEKSKGSGGEGRESADVNRASEFHGTVRVDSGVDLASVIAEYRAIRASVIRLWRESDPHTDLHDLDDLARFNESIDQSLTAAVLAYMALVERNEQGVRDEQSRRDREMRAMNEALLTTSVNQHELAEKAQNAEAALDKSQQDLAAELQAAQRLQQVSLYMASARNSEALYGNIIDAAIAILCAEFASLQMFYPERGRGGELRLLAFRGYSPEAAAAWRWISADHPTSCGMALRTSKRCVVIDTEACQWMEGTEDLAFYRQIGIRSLQSTPLISRTGTKLGMMSTCWKAPHQASERDLRLLDILARQAADLIERVKAEDSLRESEERFRMLADNMDQLAWICDKLGNVTWYNQRWLDYTGMLFDEMKGWDWSKVQHPDHLDRVIAGVKHSAETGEPWDDTFPLRGKDGKYRWFLSRALPIRDEAGEIVRWFGTNTDISAQREMELALDIAREQAETANRAKDKFLAVLSHELRTPLTPVIMAVAAMDMNPDLVPAVRDDIAMIRRNVELEVKLIDDLLDLSRVTTGKLRLNMEAVEVNSAVRHVCETCRPYILEKAIHLHCDLPEETAFVEADPARLQQVLWNLLRNAAKFTPDHGDIYVTAAEVATGHVRIEVRDTGIGISSDVLPLIFDAFEQGNANITRQFGGMGLGLAISKALIEIHHGTIRADSKGKDRGSIFAVELPSLALERIPKAQPEQASIEGSGKKLRVLVVEDHPDTAEMLARLLRTSGYIVRTSHTVAAALQLAAAERFDVIVSDIGLPDATGYELMEKIKQRYPIKGIAMSGYGMDEDLRKSREAGFSDHLVKPANVAQLDRLIRRIVAKD